MSTKQYPKYTFLVPAFKAKFLKYALDSIQQQTYTNFKVIVSDDCSPESLETIFDKYNQDSRFEYRKNEKNLGKENLIAHWNLLVNICKTEYFILASDDDVYEFNFLEEVDKLTTKYPEVDLIHARVKEIDANNNITRKDALYEERVSQLEFISQYAYFNHIECIANNVFRTKSLKDIGGFFDFPLAWSSDTATSFALAKNGVANTKEILFSFRMSGLNLSSKNLEDKEITIKKFEAIMKYYDCVNNIINSIHAQNTYESHLLNLIQLYHRKHVISAASYYAIALPLKRFLLFIHDFNRIGLFDNKYQIYQILKKKLYNLI